MISRMRCGARQRARSQFRGIGQPQVANGHQAAFPVARSASGIPGFTGDACAICNSFTMIRSGTCQTCLSCGETSGCS